jgi:ABC-type uncharacterized transport system permease subunit
MSKDASEAGLRLQLWQLVSSIVLGSATIVVSLLGYIGYVGTSAVFLLVLILMILLVVLTLSIIPQTHASFWMKKVNAVNALRLSYLDQNDHSRGSKPGLVYRSALEIAYGHAVVAGNQTRADYFKRLIDEYESTVT